MAKIYSSVEELIGGTPLLEVSRLERAHGLCARLLVKLEYLNPTGSAKDRAALFMINDAERRGQLLPGGTIIEPTSGNTGIGLASVAAARGYKTVIVMPDSMSVERQKLMQAYGAKLVLTPGSLGMEGAIDKAYELSSDIPNSIVAGQFENPANAEAHFETTGPEIWRDTDGQVDCFVAGVGTGGTITGTGRYLKQQNPDVHIVAVEPASSAVLSGEEPGAHGLQGIGAGFVPKVLDITVYDEIVKITEAQAYAACRELGTREGIAVGISSGAALAAAMELARRDCYRGKTIVALLPDTGDRYLSTDLFG